VSAARDYRLSAEQCRRRAEAAVDEVSKVMCRVFAGEWLKFAAEAEQGLPAGRQPLAENRWTLAMRYVRARGQLLVRSPKLRERPRRVWRGQVRHKVVCVPGGRETCLQFYWAGHSFS
jgi:hypothetical protein